MPREHSNARVLRNRRRTDGARILVIEDSDDLRALMEFTLEQEGYLVDAAPSAEEGLRFLERHTYRLVLSDYALPGQSGIWLLSEALERGLLRGAATRIVTADPDATGIGSRANVVPKPVDFERFLPQVRAILASQADDAGQTDVAAPAAANGVVELILYVSPASLPCARALRVMQQLLQRYDNRRIHFSVCDVAADPQRAARDHVVFTPSLVKRRPSPRVWIVGNLEQSQVVTDMLVACGVADL
jgi:CheY-like chemotaxis protein